MARFMSGDWGIKVWLSADDTYEWAHRPGRVWPCSQLSGHRVFAEFDRSGDLVDMAIDGKSDVDCDAAEFSACISDFLTDRFGPDHPVSI